MSGCDSHARVLARPIAICLTLAALALAAGASGARAQQVDLVDIEDEVMCVTCRVPLNIAEGAQPDSQRDYIRELIAQGQTKEQIKQALVGEYGPEVLALPDQGGFGITAYAIPLALGALVVGGLALLLPRWRRRARAVAPGGGDAVPALSDEDAARLDADLAQYRS